MKRKKFLSSISISVFFLSTFNFSEAGNASSSSRTSVQSGASKKSNKKPSSFEIGAGEISNSSSSSSSSPDNSPKKKKARIEKSSEASKVTVSESGFIVLSAEQQKVVDEFKARLNGKSIEGCDFFASKGCKTFQQKEQQFEAFLRWTLEPFAEKGKNFIKQLKETPQIKKFLEQYPTFKPAFVEILREGTKSDGKTNSIGKKKDPLVEHVQNALVGALAMTPLWENFVEAFNNATLFPKDPIQTDNYDYYKSTGSRLATDPNVHWSHWVGAVYNVSNNYGNGNEGFTKNEAKELNLRIFCALLQAKEGIYQRASDAIGHLGNKVLEYFPETKATNEMLFTLEWKGHLTFVFKILNGLSSKLYLRLGRYLNETLDNTELALLAWKQADKFKPRDGDGTMPKDAIKLDLEELGEITVKIMDCLNSGKLFNPNQPQIKKLINYYDNWCGKILDRLDELDGIQKKAST